MSGFLFQDLHSPVQTPVVEADKGIIQNQRGFRSQLGGNCQPQCQV